MPDRIPVVDPEKCTGCATCEALCPDVFHVEDDNKSHVKDPSACEQCDCQAAIDSCPQKAISWSE